MFTHVCLVVVEIPATRISKDHHLSRCDLKTQLGICVRPRDTATTAMVPARFDQPIPTSIKGHASGRSTSLEPKASVDLSLHSALACRTQLR